ncbi:hypothetical protein M408DRAFT_332886 [Serendipita vermifera MAFF 305830]|uniref:Uncharacterized protein n=1 Tax=Serendipita vermifera MAFF 305830 TaxID=933852 RepID=A0A0C3AT86_SERVB|nr:hypothetical protein M408DRAFT_332886 [Serendipita vermifera MAFF 305830]
MPLPRNEIASVDVYIYMRRPLSCWWNVRMLIQHRFRSRLMSNLLRMKAPPYRE